MKYFEFPCGCKFPIIGETPDGRPKLTIDLRLESLPLDCQRTWDLISSGNTKGVFQLESRLGQSLAKKLKPNNIEHLSALIAIMRPGALEAVTDGKNATMHYIDRKNGEEEITYFHPALEPILKDTYGVLCFQEASMQIANQIAGMSLESCDLLRKSIGKKDTSLMTQVKKKFIEGCKETSIVNEEEAQEIFNWIEKSQRYAFNSAHSVSYAMNTYLSAYVKAHFPRAFYTAYLYYAREKTKPREEINELINNAKLQNIEVLPPSLIRKNKHFKLYDKNIYFGITDVKGLGESVYKKMDKAIDAAEKITQKPLTEMSWLEFLVFVCPNVTSTAITNLISVGALRHLDVNRARMLYEYDVYNKLSQREQKWCESYCLSYGVTDLQNLLTALINAPVGKDGGCSNKNRLKKTTAIVDSMSNPPYSLTDKPEWIAGLEESLLGIPITCAAVESCDINAANCTCKDFLQEKQFSKIAIIAVQVEAVKEIKTKRGTNPGQKMAFITASDVTGLMDNIVVFPDTWLSAKRLLVEGNHVMIFGEKGKDNSFVLNKVYQI